MLYLSAIVHSSQTDATGKVKNVTINKIIFNIYSSFQSYL